MAAGVIRYDRGFPGPGGPARQDSPTMKQDLIDTIRAVVRDARDEVELIRQAVQAIHDSSPRYDWTGIYMLNGSELVLRSFIGQPSPHETIPIGEGICGAAVRDARTVIVPDVNDDPRYLACSLETRSEIVVPIFRDGRVIGEIDIDSHTPDAFGAEDREVLEEIACLIGPRLQGTSS